MDAPETNAPVTLRDIARVLGISHVAVSMALRNNPQIPAARRDQVRELAMRMGYRPNAAAASLAGHKRRTRVAPPVKAALAWLNRWPQPEQLRRYAEFDRYWRGAYAAAEKFGYRLEEFVCGGRLTLPRLEKVLVARGVRGVLLPPHPQGVRWEGFRWENFTAIRFGRSIPAPRLHLVTGDQGAGTFFGRLELGLKARRCAGAAMKGFCHSLCSHSWEKLPP